MLQQTDIVKFIREGHSDVICIVACGKAKLSNAVPARQLYTSPLFQKSLGVAEAIGASTYILSAHYGLVSPDDIIRPYDMHISSLSRAQLEKWRAQVQLTLRTLPQRCTTLLVFGGAKYLREVTRLVADKEIVDVFGGSSLGHRMRHLASLHRVVEREVATISLYSSLELMWENGQIVPFNIFSKMQLPRRGVYIFFNPTERSRYSQMVPRIVRIGTHAVARTSRSSLRNRLRSHYGLRSGGGNHRGSVFRLHVGQSMLRETLAEANYPHWGHGQSADQSTRVVEQGIEQLVSKYIRHLQVAVFEIDDPPSSKSLRSRVEEALITILAGEGGALDVPSARWLGRYCKNPSIVESGLWNVQHVGKALNPSSTEKALRIIHQQRRDLL